jgi:hypothetical protein
VAHHTSGIQNPEKDDFRRPLPRNPSEKILKRELHRLYDAEATTIVS